MRLYVCRNSGPDKEKLTDMKGFVLYFLRNKAVTWLLLALVIGGGTLAYFKMGKLEDAPFTIKQAVVTTAYPGASAREVAEQVSDVLEESIQELDELYYLKTENRDGFSKITVYVKKEIRADAMQQLWDKLRRKVSDAGSKLPEGAGEPVVNDDFGDVLGVFYALRGENRTSRELEEVAEDLKKRLLKIDHLAKVEICGLQVPAIDIWAEPSLMAAKGIDAEMVAAAIARQNKIVDAGSLENRSSRLRIEAQGSFNSIGEIRDLRLVSGTGENVRLGDVAYVCEGYRSPLTEMMYVDGIPSVGLAMSTAPGGDVVEMAQRVKEVVGEFSETLPEGMDAVCIYDQGKESAEANDGFVVNLLVSVATVIGILLFFVGLRNGILVGSGLVFSILATLLYMWATGIPLQRMSLAAIIIAMGMLVDNAIVVFDSAQMNMCKGMRKRTALLEAVSSTAMPLLAATAIAVLTFWPLYLSPDVTGELLYSLVIVIGVSLFSSWVFALVQTPFFIQEFMPRPRFGSAQGDPYRGKAYDSFRKILGWIVRRKVFVVVLAVVVLIVTSCCFGFVPKLFLPQLDKQYFTVDLRTEEGTRIEHTRDQALLVEEYVRSLEDVRHVSLFVGKTPPRYYLANAAYGPQPTFAHLVVEARNPECSRQLQARLQECLPDLFPDVFVRVNKFELNTVPEALIEARFCGPDPEVLDSLVGQALTVMRSNPKTVNAHCEWGNRAMKIDIGYDPVKAGKIGLEKGRIMASSKSLVDGYAVGVFREKDRKVPVVLRTCGWNGTDLSRFGDSPIWNGEFSSPLRQVVSEIGYSWEWPLMKTYDRQWSMAAMCDVASGCTMAEVHGEIRKEIESIPLPEGYAFFWDSQYKTQKESMSALVKYFPLSFLLLFFILVALFGNFRQPFVVVAMLPLSLSGVVAGLLLTGFSFGFFCIAGWLGLLGMIVKNVIVLMDEANVLRRAGWTAYDALVQAAVSRSRPVLMAASTTVLGMVPLLFDVVFGSMAATIVFGLTFATLSTLLVCPALYALVYRIKK